MKKTVSLLLCFILVLSLLFCTASASAADDHEYRVISSLADLNSEGVVLGLVTGMVSDQYYAKYFPKAGMMYFNSLPDMIFALRNGQIDGFMEDGPVSKYLAAITEDLAFVDEPIGDPTDTAFVFGRSDFDEKLKSQFNEYLAKIKSDGTIEDIFALWNDTDDSKKVLDFPKTGENGTAKVCVYAETAPANYILNGQPAGFEIDILTRFCREYGYALEISPIDFPGLLNGVTSGIFNIACGYVSITEERKETVNFCDPYLSSSFLMVVRGSSEKSGFFDSIRTSFERTFIRENRWELIVQGIGTTVLISVCAAVLGTLLGFGLCMLRRLKNRVTHGFTTVYIRILQRTPLLVILMILYYIIFAKSGMSGKTVAIIAFTLYFSAYVCEMFRVGIESVDKGQTEAALALGYTRSQAFFKIVLPQAAEYFLPVYKGEYISLVKMTSVVGYIAVQDLTKMSDIIRSRTYEAFFPLIATAIIYFILSAILTTLLSAIEIKIKPDRKNRAPKGVTVK